MRKVEKMLRDLVALAEREFGTSAQPDAVHRLMAGLAAQYGGERIYVEKLPKLAAQVRIEALGTGAQPAELTMVTGLSVRQVRRITRGC